jgi:hypothetical protein
VQSNPEYARFAKNLLLSLKTDFLSMNMVFRRFVRIAKYIFIKALVITLDISLGFQGFCLYQDSFKPFKIPSFLIENQS